MSHGYPHMDNPGPIHYNPNMKIKTNHYNLIPYKEVLVIETFSSWDHRIMQQNIEDFLSITTQYYAGKEWCILVDNLQWELSTPEVTPMVQSGLESMTILPRHSAQVTGGSQVKEWYIRNMYNESPKIALQFFSTRKEAAGWLRSLGYTIPDHIDT